MQDPVDVRFMKRALELAARGEGLVAPNPLVGCVIVHESTIIGEGFHASYGGPHAEVNAIHSVSDREKLSQSTLYVTLEPCAHFGKTPPCVNLILEWKIPRVVVGCRDPFPEVNGKGIEILRHAGVEVTVDVLFDECRAMNRRFFTFHEKQRPYVVLKWAQSADGFMDIVRSPDQQGSVMISHPDTQIVVHRWRAEESAILIGKNTLINDNPSLTVRRVKGKNPIRIVLSSQPVELHNLKLSNDEAPTLVVTNESDSMSGHVRTIACGNVHDLRRVLHRLYEEKIASVLVEGGAGILKSFLESALWDEARVIVSDHSLSAGLKAPTISNAPTKIERSVTDTIHWFSNNS
jgi:diaminohydroxyphosphoribosylaminopyrimidine deaminase/5-amino-6-(5-phosphoribosylamino)uracil reductase